MSNSQIVQVISCAIRPEGEGRDGACPGWRVGGAGGGPGGGASQAAQPCSSGIPAPTAPGQGRYFAYERDRDGMRRRSQS